MKVIAYTNTDNGVSIITPIEGTVKEIAAIAVPEGIPYLVLDDSELPDYAYRSQWVIVGNNVLINPSAPSPAKAPNPKGFYEKSIGMEGEYPLYQVFKSLRDRALDQGQETSSLVAALLIYNNALNINDWTKEETKLAYLAAYTILKDFISVGQASIIDAENINFGLV